MRKLMTGLMMAGTLTGCVSKKKYDELALQQAATVTQKDSLVSDMLAATQLMTEVNADLANVKGLGVSPVSSSDRPLSGKAEERAVTLGKIREVIARLDAADKQVNDAKKRIGTMTADRKKMTQQLDEFQKTIGDMRTQALAQEAMISQQRGQITALSGRVDTLTQVTSTLTAQSAQLSTEKAAVRDTLTRAIDESNVVYYAVGTRDELIKRGILVNEGSKFLVFGGKTLQPARDLKPELFQRLDRRRDTVLTVPEPGKEYRIVTRQNPQLLGNVQPNGKLMGDLRVTSPTFWDAGKFLIVVRE